MIVFALLAAILISIALATIVIPLLRSPLQRQSRRLRKAFLQGLLSASEYEQKCSQLQQAKAGPAGNYRLLAALLALLLPAASLLLYFQIGNTDGITQPRSPVLTAEEEASPQQTIAHLQAALQDNPDEVQGWLLLAQAQREQQNYAAAAEALQRALALLPDSAPIKPDIYANLAEAEMFSSNTTQVPDAARSAIRSALQLDPRHQRAQWLQGVTAYQDQDYANAITYWNALLPQLDDTAVADSIRGQIAQAEAELARTGTTVSDNDSDQPVTAAPPPIRSDADGPEIITQLSLADNLQAEWQDNPAPVLYVFARIADSERPPLAIQRVQNPTLPVSVRLDNSSSMIPGQSLSSATADDRLQITARLSFSGDALAQPGDWQGESVITLDESTTVLDLVIDTVISE